MALCQTFKLIIYSIRDRRFVLRHLFSTGGMPSAHSALVTTLAVSIGLWRGPASEVFAAAAVFSLIIVYDSMRLRGTVDIHTRILRDLQQRVPNSADIPIRHMVGHSPKETLAGTIVGTAASVAIFLLLQPVLPGGVLPV